MKKLNIVRFAASLLITGFLLNPISQIYAAETKNAITVDIDGKYITFDQPPIIENGRTLVPMRAIFEALGATVEWLPEEQQIEAVRETPTSSLKCVIGLKEQIMYVSYTDTQIPDKPQRLWFYSDFDVPPKIVNGRTLVPARAIAEAFGTTVTWDGTAQAVHISTVNAKIVNPKTGESIVVTQNPTPHPTEQPAVTPVPKPQTDEPFTLKVGDTAGKIVKDPNDTTTLGSDRFTEPYATASEGQCTWYARGRFYEIYQVTLPYDLGGAKNWLVNATKSEQLLVITDTNDIRDKTIAVYKPTLDANHPGHVTFVEHVERDAQGKPVYIYFTEANGSNDLNKNQYDYGYDGAVQKLSFNDFTNIYGLELLGYIALK